MVLLLVRAVIFLVSAAVGLVLTSLLVDGFRLTAAGFGITVVVFAVIQSVLAPFIAKLAKRYASAFLVWLVTAAATMLLPLVMFRRTVQARRTPQVRPRS